jgi:hypothetical protein
VLLDSGSLAWHVRKHFFRFQSACGLAPPDPVVWLLEMALLAKIQDGKQKQAERGYAQQSRLQAVEEAGFHGRTLLHHPNLLLTTQLLHVGCHVGETRWLPQ